MLKTQNSCRCFYGTPVVSANPSHSNAPVRFVGSLMSAALRFYENRTCDLYELILLDIDATPQKRGPRFEEIKQVTSKVGFCPVTVGGGVRSLDDIRGLLNAGADKVAIRSNARSPFLQEAVAKFGAQCITVGIDYREIHGQMGISHGASSEIGRHRRNHPDEYGSRRNPQSL